MNAIHQPLLWQSLRAWAGRTNGPAWLARELRLYIVFQVFCLGLALLSAALGFPRSLSLCAAFPWPGPLALIVTSFIALGAWVFAGDAMGQLGARLAGQKAHSKAGFVISLLLALLIMSLDIGLNASSVKPLARQLTQAPPPSERKDIITSYDSLISQTRRERDTMQARYFTYRGKLYVPDAPTRWISQEVLDEYAALLRALSLLRETRVRELSAALSKGKNQQKHVEEEVQAKTNMLSLVVGLLYGLLLLASLRAGIGTARIQQYAMQNRQSSQPDMQDEPQPATLEEKTPPRSIDQEKYQRFLRYAAEVLSDKGRYIKLEIARRAGISRDTVSHYLRRAIDGGDLEP